MSKSRIPSLTRGLTGSSSRTPKSLTSKTSTNTSKSSNLLHYGFAIGKSNSSKAGTKKTENENGDNVNKERSQPVKEDEPEDTTTPDSEVNTAELDTQMLADNVQEECRDQEGVAPTEKHLNLSEAQLNALSYSLSELADKLSPSKTDYFDVEELDSKQKSETLGADRKNSLSRGKTSGDVGNSPHSKSPYSRKNETEVKSYLSKQKSFNKNKPLGVSKELNLSDDDKARSSEIQTDKNESIEKEVMFKAASPSHQESIESGYNSSWSACSLSEDFRSFKRSTDVDTDVDVDLNGETLKDGTNEEEQSKDETSAAEYEKALQQKISDVEKRINSLILGGNSTDSEAPNGNEGYSGKKSTEPRESGDDIKNTSDDSTRILNDGKEEILANGFQEGSNETHIDLNQNDRIGKSKSLDRPKDDEQELSRKSPFHIHKVRKTSLDESSVNAKPKRPGLVRRRTTLVTFRAPRQASAFNEVDDSGVLEIDEAGFVQCLTDVRAMKTMLLKLKRELQEAEVVSPLAKSKSISSRSIANLSNLNENDSYEETGLRRNTYDSSEVIHEKLRRIRSASLSRRKQSSCLERPNVDQLATENSTEETGEQKRKSDFDEEMKKMKEEMEELKANMKSMKQERDTLLMDKEEIEHELETKNHTIKLLQKQLEVQENSEEIAYLQRQVAALTYQNRQQQQKITELKYRASTPPNTSRSTSPTNVSKDSVKHDIKNRLRDAFVRHLEESSKSHVLLSKHIEKAEFTIGEAQKGLKSIYIAPTSQTTASKESITEVGSSSGKARPSPNLLGTPRTPEETRRHSWTANSIDKIMKTWKETAKSIENLSSGSTNNKKSSQLPKPKSLNGSPHMAFL